MTDSYLLIGKMAETFTRGVPAGQAWKPAWSGRAGPDTLGSLTSIEETSAPGLHTVPPAAVYSRTKPALAPGAIITCVGDGPVVAKLGESLPDAGTRTMLGTPSTEHATAPLLSTSTPRALVVNAFDTFPRATPSEAWSHAVAATVIVVLGATVVLVVEDEVELA